MDAIYAHARFDDLGLGARSQWVGKGNTINVACSRASKQTISIKLATTVGHFLFFIFYMTLTLQTFIWLDQLVLD